MKFSLLKCPKYLIGICVTFWFLISSVNTFAQTPEGSYTIIQLPCNSDGIIQVDITSGMTPPLDFIFIYYESPFAEDIIFSDVDALSLTATNLGVIDMILVTDDFGNSKSFYVSEFYSFWVDYFDFIEPVCPEINCTIELTINDGETPLNIDFLTLTGDYITSGTSVELPVGEYRTVFYDSNGCTDGYKYEDTLVINQTSNIQFTLESTVASCTNGSVSISSVSGAVEPYTYLWNNGSVDSAISNLVTGGYIVTLTDYLGCKQAASKYVTQSPIITLSTTITNPSCELNDGSITVFGSGGVPPYSYLFPDGQTNQTAENIGAGQFYISVTDSNGCRGEKYVSVSASSPVVVTSTYQNANCGANGSAIITPTGGVAPYNIVWNYSSSQTDFSIINLEQGYYRFTVSDANNCKRLGAVNIEDEAFSYTSLNVTPAVCPDNNGSILAYTYSDYYPITYSWSNGTTGYSNSNLAAGNYTCTMTNSVGCTTTKTAYVNSTSPLNIALSSQNPSCPYEPDGSIIATVFGGEPPYNYHWSNGETNSSISGLIQGIYQLTVTDANLCSQTKSFPLGYEDNNMDCFCIVNGTAFEDINNNCIFDDGENPLSNIKINCSGFGSVFTDSDGKYSFMLPDGDYTISETILGYYPLEACQSPSYNINVVAGSGCEMTYDFAHNVTQIHDIQTYINSVTCAVRGYNYIQKLIIKNAGTSPESNIVFGYGADGQINYSTSTDLSLYQPEPFLFSNLFSYDGNIPTLLPGEVHEIVVHFNVPSNVPLNTELDFTDTCAFIAPMSNWMNDYSPWNNLTNYCTYVVGSFDPNNIEVYPKGTGAEGLITTNDSILTYTINFENTGSYYARNIYIYDTLNPNLDPNSLIPIASSHPCITRITEDGVVSFTFEDVYLPYYGIGKYGYVKYSVKQNDNLSAGTQIFNSANIVFDFNEPIVTNTVVNTIDQNVDIDLNGVTKEYIIYPNPTQNYFTIKGGDFTSVSVYNSLGQIMLNENDSDTINIEFLESGIYFVKINTIEGIVIKKLIKQ